MGEQVRDSISANLDVSAFNKTISRLLSSKMQLWDAYTQLLDRLFILQTKSLMDHNRGWDDLQLQAKLQEHLKDDWVWFREVTVHLEQNLDYFRSKLSVTENFLVSC